MSDTKLTGKTKADLVTIAALSGLLTKTEANRMTKAKLLEFLESAAAESDGKSTATKAAEDRTDDKQTTKSGKTAKADDDKAEDKPAPKRRGRPRKQDAVKEASSEADDDKSAKAKTTRKSSKQAAEKDAEDNRDEESSGKKKSAKGKKQSKKKSPKKDEAESDDDAVKGEADDNDSADNASEDGKPAQETVSGVLEIMADGYGFLRCENYLQSNNDIYVPPQYIRRFNLRNGDFVEGPARQQRDNDRYKALFYINQVNGMPPDKMVRRPRFDRLTPIYPNERFVLETERTELSTRIIDLVAPVGKGQRAMIVSPPKAGKTILLQKIANAISVNNPEAKLIVLLIDERPEEVTDMQRSIEGEVVYSTFDKTPENHVRVTELVLERAMRLVELGQDVVILLDSITRMARAYNLTINPTGRTLSGGLDPGALYGPKRFFGAARNIEHGGSLTIIATALVETGSRMDEVIFEEFKGTGNMEVYLDRKLAEKRIFPALDVMRSGTRREELLLSRNELDATWAIRKAFGSLDTPAVTETIISMLLKTKDNQQFISSINVSFNDQSLFESMRGSVGKQQSDNRNSERA